MFPNYYLWLQLVTTFVLALILVWYLYYKYCFTYWSRKGLPTIPPKFPAGNITFPMLGQENLFVRLQNLYKEFKKQGHRHAGLYFFNGPIYFPTDPEIIKSIMTTDFEYFTDRGTFIDEERLPLGAHLFSLTGLEWRNLRRKLNPVYTSGKLRNIFEVIKEVSGDFVKSFEKVTEGGGCEIDIKKKAENLTADMISSSAFGVNCNTVDNPDHELSCVLQAIQRPSTLTFIKAVVLEGFQNPGNLIKAIVSNPRVENFFRRFVKDVLKVAEESNFQHCNLFNTLLTIKNNAGLTDNQILGEVFLFFLAGFETSSATISLCIHELAHNQDLQEKLRRELHGNLGSDLSKYTYEGIRDLPFLNKVFQETLRLYPVLGAFNRICVKPYTVPGTDITIEKGTPVLIPVLGLQRDPEYYPDPLRFDPDRFNEKDSQTPFTYMPFGEGPRSCIGMRLGKLQTKMGIAGLVANYRFFPSDKTPKVIEYDKLSKTQAMCPKQGITVKVEKL